MSACQPFFRPLTVNAQPRLMTQAHLIFDFDPGNNEDLADDINDQNDTPLQPGSAASPLDLLLRHRRGRSDSGHPEEEEWDVRLMHLIASQPDDLVSEGRAFRPRSL